MTVHFRKAVVSLLLLGTITSCKPKEGLPDNFDYGRVENGVYSNAYFDFDIPLPADWVIRNREDMERIYEAGHEVVREKNEQLASQLEASKINRATLLSLVKSTSDITADTTDTPGASFSIVVENLSTHPAVRNSRDYLSQAAQLLEQSGLDYTITPGFVSEQVGNRLFDRMDLRLLHNGTTVHQTYYVTIVRRFALCILLSYVEDADGLELKDIAAKINFS